METLGSEGGFFTHPPLTATFEKIITRLSVLKRELPSGYEGTTESTVTIEGPVDGCGLRGGISHWTSVFCAYVYCSLHYSSSIVGGCSPRGYRMGFDQPSASAPAQLA